MLPDTATKRLQADRAVHLSVTQCVKTETLSTGALVGSVSRIKLWSFSQPQTTVICLMGNATADWEISVDFALNEKNYNYDFYYDQLSILP